jgi:serine/threonine-protein kinase PknK
MLKDRIADIEQLTTTLERIADGESVVDPSIVEELLATRRVQDPLAELTTRELEVLALLAEGRTDRGIARQLFITPKTVEAHVRSIFRKLRLPTDPAENRRVHAVLTFLRGQPPAGA